MNQSGEAVDFTLRLDLSDTDVLELLRGKKSRVAHEVGSLAQTSVSARYSPISDTITLTSLLHKRFPVNFRLKAGSRSYTNFLRLLARELSELKNNLDGSTDTESTQRVQELRKRLSVLLERASVEVGDEGIEVVDLYRGDFELLQGKEDEVVLPSSVGGESPGIRVIDHATGKPLVRANWSDKARRFRFFGEKEPLLISGFMDEEVGRSEPTVCPAMLFDDWRSEVRFSPDLSIELLPGEVKIAGMVMIPLALRPMLELFVHWGPSAGVSWRDEEIAPFELREQEGMWLSFEKNLRPEQLGEHGVTLCAQVVGTTQRVWFSDFGIANHSFEVAKDTLYASTKRVHLRRVSEATLQSKLLRSMTSFSRFVRVVDQFARAGTQRRVARVLYEVSREDIELRNLLDSFFVRIEQALSSGESSFSRSVLRRVRQVLTTIGIGEVVFVTPEGPHAIAGGLAQVVVGLTKGLAREGVPTTIIAPLYECAQGSKHTSAETLLAEGVVLADQRVPVELWGEIKICFGATRIAGTLQQQQFARVVPVQVYKAERGSVRLLLLRHHSLADALYSFSSGEDALRKAVFLARGALEVLRSRDFDIVPDTIISNDWLTALIPAYLSCDSRYKDFAGFEEIRSVHMIHNAGPAFQGRFFVNEFGEDLWPIIGLGDEHFFWLSDPSSVDYLNLTAGAIRHVSGAILTVSQPYSTELMKPEIGGALAGLLQSRRDRVFGISNGVDTEALRLVYRDLGEDARKRQGLVPLFRGKRVRSESIVRKLASIKQSIKRRCQIDYGLEQREDAILISLVGRLTAQKGIQLLTDPLKGKKVAAIEALLKNRPEVQLLVAGPLCLEESEVRGFEEVFSQLVTNYPGRVAGSFDFLPHREALAITCASDLFLMPSKYEPGGITQLEALSAGTAVVGHRVGGIGATLKQFDATTKTGDSFLFSNFSADAFYGAALEAVRCMRQRELRLALQRSAVSAEHDWADRVPTYLALFHSISGLLEGSGQYTFLAREQRTLDAIRPHETGLVPAFQTLNQ